MKLIVGLGNPGTEYENTRHNAGFMCIDNLIKKYNYIQSINKFNGLAYVNIINNEKVLFLKPLTFMNLSGDCIIEYVNFFKIEIKDILIIFDDKDLDINQIKWRAKGSSGGHNGLKSIISRVKSEEFHRLKLGVGKPPNKNFDTAKWVLSRFSNEELVILNENILFVMQGIDDFINNKKFNDIATKYSRLNKG